MCQRMSTSIYQRKMFQGLFAVPGKMTISLEFILTMESSLEVQ